MPSRTKSSRVDAGQFKYLGEWLSRQEAMRRRIQIVAMQVFGTMQQQAAGADLVGAMQTFDTIEKDYITTRIYPDAVTLAKQVLVRLQQDLVVRMEADKGRTGATPEHDRLYRRAREIANHRPSQSRGGTRPRPSSPTRSKAASSGFP